MCEQAYYYDPGGGSGGAGLTSEFRACRISYEPAHGMIVNPEISNMGFEEFVDEKAGEQGDGARKWRLFPPNTNADLEDMAKEDIKRTNALRELRDGDSGACWFICSYRCLTAQGRRLLEFRDDSETPSSLDAHHRKIIYA